VKAKNDTCENKKTTSCFLSILLQRSLCYVFLLSIMPSKKKKWSNNFDKNFDWGDSKGNL